MIRKNIFLLLVCCVLIAGLNTGCIDIEDINTKYLEEETPPGTVPPPPENTPKIDTESQLSNTPDQSAAEVKQETISDFTKAYAATGSPRIAIFLNRALSDEVRQWQASERVVVSGEGEKVKITRTDNILVPGAAVDSIQSGAEVEGSEDKKRAITAQAQNYVEEESRYGPGERWMWAFEDGVLDPFLEAKVNVIDRTTIIRLAAAKSSEGSDIQPITVKQVEMDALKDHADVFIEMLVSRSMSAVYGYEFKASVKDVKTGRILANVTSADWKGKRRRGRAVVATSEGYQLGGGMRLPAVKDIASDLAIDVMKELIHTWGY